MLHTVSNTQADWWRESSQCCQVQRPASHLGEASVIMSHHRRVGAVQLLDDLKALVELSEDVHHRAGEQRVLRRLLELQAEGREDKLQNCRAQVALSILTDSHFLSYSSLKPFPFLSLAAESVLM